MRTLSKWEIAEIKAVFLYVVRQFGEVDYYKAFKAIYFAHRNHLAKYGLPLIPDTFCAFTDGPVPSFLYDEVKAAIKGGNQTKHALLVNSINSVCGKDSYVISASELPDMDEISESVKELLDLSIEYCRPKTYKELRDESHDEAYLNVYQRGKSKPNPLDTVQIALAGGASSEFAEHVREMVEFNTLASV